MCVSAAIGGGLLAGGISALASNQAAKKQKKAGMQANALLQQGLLSTVNAAIASMQGDAGEAARIEWEFSSTVERARPLVQGLAVALNLSEGQLDDLFELAATL